MKMLFMKFNKNRQVKKRISIEKILIFSFVGIFALLLVVQAIMSVPSAKTIFSYNVESFGEPLGLEEFLYDEGQLGLEIQGVSNDKNIKVLVNGEEFSAFMSKEVYLNLKDGDVVEIDGSASKTERSVKIISKSDNVTNECVGNAVTVKSDVKKLVRLKVKKDV